MVLIKAVKGIIRTLQKSVAVFLKQQCGEKKSKIQKERHDNHLCGSKVSTKQYYILFKSTVKYVKVQGETGMNHIRLVSVVASGAWGSVGQLKNLGFICIALERQEDRGRKKKEPKANLTICQQLLILGGRTIVISIVFKNFGFSCSTQSPRIGELGQFSIFMRLTRCLLRQGSTSVFNF